MFSKKEEPRLLIPALKPFYERVIPLSWVVVRFAVGWNLLVHAYFSIGRGPLALAPVFEKMGFAPGNVFAGTTFLIELLGGIGNSCSVYSRVFSPQQRQSRCLSSFSYIGMSASLGSKVATNMH